jgi:plasmid maintenance system antidote protein VapI
MVPARHQGHNRLIRSYLRVIFMPRRDMQNPVQPGAESARSAVNPLAISVTDAARLLGISETVLRRHIEEGAPVGTDGVINLVHYAAWLNVQSREAETAVGD